MAIGAATILGRFGARLGMDTSDYSRGILNAEGVTRVFGQTFATFVSNPLLGSLDLLKKAGGAFLSMSSSVLANAEDVARLSNELNISVELLQALQGRLELAGKSADVAGTSMGFFSKFLDDAKQGLGPATDALERLGLRAEDLGNTEHAFIVILEALSQVEDGGVRAALAMDLFGRRGGTQLVDAIGGGAAAVAAMRREQEGLANVIDGRSVNALAGFNTSVGAMKELLENLPERAIAEFLAGFAGDFDTGTNGVIELGSAVQDRYLPAIRQAGQETARFIGTLDDFLGRIEKLIEYLERVIELEQSGTIGGQSIPVLTQGAKLQNAAQQDAADIFSGNFSRLFSFDRFGIFD